MTTYYTWNNAPIAGSRGISSLIRSEFTAIQTGFTTVNSEMVLKAPLASPALTGTPIAPTAAVGTNTTQIATCAHVFATAMTAALPGISGAVADYFTTNNGTVGSWSNLLKATVIRFADGADTTKRMTFGLTGITAGQTRTLTVPDYDGTIATLAGTETLTNKSLSDLTTFIVDEGDATKKAQFQASGITAGQTRTVTIPDYSGTLGLMAKGADIASAATINLDTATGDFVHVTGTTTITAITLASGLERTVVFDGALTLTHNATTLILPGGANITTAAGDRATFRGDGTGNVRCIHYTKASGQAVVAPATTSAATQAEMEAASSNTVMATPANMNWHPGVAKVFLNAKGDGTGINTSLNVTSVTDDGTGILTVTIATDFSSANYAVCAASIGSTTKSYVSVDSVAAGSFRLQCMNSALSAAVDPVAYGVACFGDQA